ncbi:MAG: methylmalonyl Co-A mutase-associated GTPase MeaB [Desulfurococcales archaeon]|nr:methylmalonyl Co-A mutase-associated GTPase MeaB [Desulfurococcales archaeon]
MNDLDRALENLIARAEKGDIRATGRILTMLEVPGETSIRLLKLLHRKTGKAHVIGITGIPGAGKSSLINRLIQELRRRGYRVAVVAIDPSSPLSQGSLLGDRLRMQVHSVDPGVFIRSISTRGLKGGLSLAGLAMIEAFDALGYDYILLETVGVGQAEVDVINAAHTIIVVTMPGAGDDIQALKAGVMEIGDIYVVNKSDKPEATKTYEFIVFSVEKGDLGPSTGWIPRVLMVSSLVGTNIDKLVDTIEEHKQYLQQNSLFHEKVKARRKLLAYYMVKTAIDQLVEDIALSRETGNELDIEDLTARIRKELCSRLLG